jgi:hypothetical protein
MAFPIFGEDSPQQRLRGCTLICMVDALFIEFPFMEAMALKMKQRIDGMMPAWAVQEVEWEE